MGLWKTLKSLGLSSKERNMPKLLLNEDGAIQLELQENANIINFAVVPLKTTKLIYLTINKLMYLMLLKQFCLV